MISKLDLLSFINEASVFKTMYAQLTWHMCSDTGRSDFPSEGFA